MSEVHNTIELIHLAEVILSIVISVRILMRHKPASFTIAWLLIVLSLPLFGSIIYLIIGENRVGEKRLQRGRLIRQTASSWINDIVSTHNETVTDNKWQNRSEQVQKLEYQVNNIVGIPGVTGNTLQLLSDYETIFSSLILDINNASKSCYLEFYILVEGGLTDELLEALIRARQRGVVCKLMLDAQGSKSFFQGQRVNELQGFKIEVLQALPVSPLKMLFRRMDLRNHRKIAVIDGQLAYIGSQNLVDPRYFKQDSNVGQWVDIMVRVNGPASFLLEGIFSMDWEIETGDKVSLSDLVIDNSEETLSTLQVVPSGPIYSEGAIHQILMAVCYSAKEKLILSTPYFIPDDALLEAIVAASQRGVEVTLIIPEKIDSLLVRYTTSTYMSRLLDAGVEVALFNQGLLHTKAISVDGQYCMLGSVNLDMRSFWLNFEISTLIYDQAFTAQVDALMDDYLNQSIWLTRDMLKEQGPVREFASSILRLVTPVL